MIQTRGLSVYRGRRCIIGTVEFEARSGQITVIAGPNGSGKTTLLQALCQDLPYRGRVFINGVDATALKPRQKAQIRGILPQAATLAFPFLVREVLEPGISAGNAAAAGRDAVGDIAEAALRRVDLAGYGGRFYQELSGGEQARVQLARVLCQMWNARHEGRPCWLLLDEPVASLDIEHQLIVMGIMQAFARAGGGVIAVLHDLNLAAGHADRLVLMQQGRLVHDGTPAAVMTSENLRQVYNCRIDVNRVPDDGIPFVLPQTVRQESAFPLTGNTSPGTGQFLPCTWKWR